MWFGDMGLSLDWGFLRLVRLSFVGQVCGCYGAVYGVAPPLSVLACVSSSCDYPCCAECMDGYSRVLQ